MRLLNLKLLFYNLGKLSHNIFACTSNIIAKNILKKY